MLLCSGCTDSQVVLFMNAMLIMALLAYVIHIFLWLLLVFITNAIYVMHASVGCLFLWYHCNHSLNVCAWEQKRNSDRLESYPFKTSQEKRGIAETTAPKIDWVRLSEICQGCSLSEFAAKVLSLGFLLLRQASRFVLYCSSHFSAWTGIFHCIIVIFFFKISFICRCSCRYFTCSISQEHAARLPNRRPRHAGAALDRVAVFEIT